MKLFQRLLVAPAALGLLSPISVVATEVNLNDISNYSDEEIEIDSNSFDNYSTSNPLLAGGEGLTDSHDHGSDSFSSTTSASFGVDFVIGAVDGDATGQKTSAIYGYGIGLSTSFTGEDSLDVAIDAGSTQASLEEADTNSTTDDALVVDGITYTFPIGEKLTVLVGDSTSGSALYSTACAYGGFTNTLDDCGNGNSAFGTNSDSSVGFSASYDIGGGFTGAIGYVGSGSGTKGLMTDESLDYVGGQLAYSTDSYGVSVTYATKDDSASAETIYWGLNGYWSPSEAGAVPSISVGVENGAVSDETGGLAGAAADGGAAASGNRRDTHQWFAGIQWDEAGPGTLGIAYGSAGAIAEDSEQLNMYEVFYSYPVNDSMTITPAIYGKETLGTADDETGILVETSFSF